MLRKLAFLGVMPLWATLAVAQITVTNAGGIVTQATNLVVTNSMVSNPAGTLSFTCPLTAFAPGQDVQIWACTGGSFTLLSSDRSLSVNATFDPDSKLTLITSGGGIGGRPKNYLYTLRATFTGTVTQDGQIKSATGTTIQSYRSAGTPLGPLSGSSAIESGTITINSGSPGIALTISKVSVQDIGQTSVAIEWVTNISGDSVVEYGTTSAYGSSASGGPNKVLHHEVDLTGLASGTTYHYRVKSKDQAGNVMASPDSTFATRSAGALDSTLYYPKLPLYLGEYTGIGLSNTGSGAASLEFRAYDKIGVEMSLTNPPTPASRILVAGAQLPIIDDQLFGAGNIETRPGWGKITSSSSDLTGFFLTFNGSLTSMDGTGLSRSLIPFTVLSEIGVQDYTRIFLANPNSNNASVTIDLVKSDGTVRSTYEGTIKANGTFAGDLKTDIFPGAISDSTDYIQVTSDKGLLHYESFGKNAGDTAVLAGQDLNKGASILYAPQYVVGGPWRSTLSIVNLDPDPGIVTFKLVGDDGLQKGDTRTLTIAGAGKIFISDPAFFGSSATGSADQIIQGYVQVVASGMRLAGSVVYGDVNGESFTTSMPLVSSLEKAMVLSQIASDDTYFTGVAIVNPNDQPVTAAIKLYNADGILQGSVEPVIPAGQRKSQMLTEYFPEIAGRDLHSGYIVVTTDAGVACFGVYGTHNLSVLSAIQASAIR